MTSGELPPEMPEWLLFDLGGVLVEFSGVRDLGALLRSAAPEDVILHKWIGCEITRAFETGHLTPEEFAERFVSEWRVSVPAADFLPQFTSWSRGFFPGAVDVLTSLRPQFRLACLSNSNASHWGRNEEIGILREFEVALSSHELGCHKPEREIFEKALVALGARPEEVMFFDDSAVNVAAAQALGIRSVQVRGIEELEVAITRIGLLQRA